jgi:hypothetical protein
MSRLVLMTASSTLVATYVDNEGRRGWLELDVCICLEYVSDVLTYLELSIGDSLDCVVLAFDLRLNLRSKPSIVIELGCRMYAYGCIVFYGQEYQRRIISVCVIRNLRILNFTKVIPVSVR